MQLKSQSQSNLYKFRFSSNINSFANVYSRNMPKLPKRMYSIRIHKIITSYKQSIRKNNARKRYDTTRHDTKRKKQ